MKKQAESEVVKEVAKNILIAIGMVGVVSAVMVAPGLAKVLPILSNVDVRRINQEIKRLQKRSLIEVIKKKNGVQLLKLTKDGKKRLVQYDIDKLIIDKPLNWDGKWRVVIFDIPVVKNRLREQLRRKIKQIGFYKLQSSVFVYPFPCYEVVSFIREYFDVKAEVEYLEVSSLENQDKLIEYFFT